MSSRLDLHFLGPPQVHLDRESVTLGRRKALALLAYLAVNGGRQTRDSLSALFWPEYDQSKAFTNLRHILWEIHQTIGEGWVIADRETIEWNREAEFSLDVRQFESLLKQSQADPSLRTSLLSDAAKLYRNHFLTGFSLKDAPEFNEWAFVESEDLKHQLGRALTTLSEELCAQGQAEHAIPYARRLIGLDPLNESSHRQMMEVYLQAGQHTAALKQYQSCEQILRRELGMDPQPATRDLYKKIRKRDVNPVPAETPREIRSPQHNLPHQISSFIGREKEQKAVQRLIEGHRLVTLIGAGGIGKTRLSLKVGEALLAQLPDGVWFVELASLNDPGLVLQAVSTVFGIVERSENTLPQKLVQSLQPKSLLLILDNCEHLIDAGAQLSETLLKNCPRLKILATSREALGVPGEAVYRVPTLRMPNGGPVGRIGDYESIRLFTERARLSASEFSFTEETSPVVAQICRRLDGIPLAIELAAARVSTLSVEQIAQRLNESFSLLTSNSRTRMERQQTLQASIDWSWNLLSGTERVLLRRLSVFAGGWTLEAAESICIGEEVESHQVLDLLTQLVMKSLVVVEQEAGQEKRYRLLEMIRQYARGKLDQTDEGMTVRTRHLNYFLHVAGSAETELRGPGRVEWIVKLNDELNNLRAALHWADQTDTETGLLLAARLHRYWEISDLREGSHWLETFLQKPGSNEMPLARAHALHTYGWLLTWLQQFEKAKSLTEESLALFRAAGDRQGEVDAIISLANLEQFLDRLASAEQLLQHSLALAKALNDTWREANVYYFLGWDRRDFPQALRYWDKALSLYRSVGDQIALANLLGALGQFRVLDGDIDLGEKYLDEALLLWQSNERANVWQNPKIAKSLVATIRGDHEQAYALLQEALLATRETGNRMSYLWVRVRLGHAALRAGHLEEARSTLAETARGFQKDAYSVGTVFALEGIAALELTVGRHELAAPLIGFADAARERVQDHRMSLEQADVDRMIAACLAKMGEVAFSDAYDEGRLMTLDQAVAFALREQ